MEYSNKRFKKCVSLVVSLKLMSLSGGEVSCTSLVNVFVCEGDGPGRVQHQQNLNAVYIIKKKKSTSVIY